MKIKPVHFRSLWNNNPWSRLYIMLLLLIPVPIFILYNMLFYRLPSIKKTTDDIQYSLQIRYESLRDNEVAYEKEMNIAINNWDNVRNKIPESYEAVSDLIIDLNTFVASKGFEMNYTLGELKPYLNGAAKLSLLPLNLKLKATGIEKDQNESVPVGLIQLVELLRDIVKSYYGIDLPTVVVNGTGDGIKMIDVNINLWVGFGNELHNTINDV